MSGPRRFGTRPMAATLNLSADELRVLMDALPDGALRQKLQGAHRAATARRWNHERVIAAIRLWAELYGEPPRAREWSYTKLERAGKDEQLRRYVSGNWPAASTVEDYFGSWNAGLSAAGFGTRKPGPQIQVYFTKAAA